MQLYQQQVCPVPQPWPGTVLSETLYESIRIIGKASFDRYYIRMLIPVVVHDDQRFYHRIDLVPVDKPDKLSLQFMILHSAQLQEINIMSIFDSLFRDKAPGNRTLPG
jgi:hypothetical protein